MLVLFLSVFVCPVFASKVLQLNDGDFHAKVKENPLTMVKFYAPWCGHCKRLAPEYEKAAEELSKLNPPIHLAEVDCTTEKEVCQEAGVSGYPTLKVYREDSEPVSYDGQRTADAIYEYMKTQSLPAAIEFKNINELDKYIEENKPVVAAYIQSTDEPSLKILKYVAKSMLGHVYFTYTFDSSVLKVPDNQNSLRLFRPKFLRTKLEDQEVDYEGEFTSSDIKMWIRKHGYGVVGYRTSRNQDFFPQKGLLILYNNATAESYPQGVGYYRNRMIQAIHKADALHSDLTFVYSPIDDHQSEADMLGYNGELPFVAIKSSTGKKFKLDKYSPDALVEFMKKYMEGTLVPHIKSEPIPESQPNFVKRVVAANFDEIVNDPTKDVLIAFVASWCGHCQALKPKFESAAEKLKDETGVILASMDANENDVPETFKVSGFPTIYFVPKRNKQNPVTYNAGREVDDIIKYVARESTEELVRFDRSGQERKTEL